MKKTMFKRVLCTMMAMLMVLSCVTVVSANETEAEPTVYYDMIDISNVAKAEVYKSSAAGADLSFNRWDLSPHYLCYGSTYYYRQALNKESIEALLDENGVLYDKAMVPYSMPLEKAINVQGVVTPSTTVELEDGAYSKVHFLAAVRDAGADTTTALNVTVNYTDGTSSNTSFSTKMYGAGSSTEVDNFVMAPMSHNSNWNPGSAEDLYADFGAAGGAFNVYTYAVTPESGKTVSSVTFSSSYQQTCVKVLAVTAQTTLSTQSLIDEVEALLASEKYLAAKKVLERIEKRADAVAKEYLTSEKYFHAMAVITDNSPYFDMIDISNVAKAEVYKSSAAGADLSFNRWDLSPHYLCYGSTYYYRQALNKESIEALLDENGVLYDKAYVPYSMPLEKAINVQGVVTPSTTVELEDGAYSKVHFLAAVRDAGADTTTAVNVTVNYTDGTTSTASFANKMYGASGSTEVDSFVMAPMAHNSNWNAGSAEDLYANFGAAGGSFNVYTYAVTPESGKTVSSITFTSSYQSTCVKVLAVTAQTTVSTQSLIDEAGAKLASENYLAAEKILERIAARNDDEAKAYVASAEYVAAIDAINTYRPTFNMVDISDVATAEVYKSSAEGADLSFNRWNLSPHYLCYGSSYNYRRALNKESIEALLDENGVLYDKAMVPYSMPLERAINVQGVVTPSTTVDLEDGAYSKVHFLAAVLDAGTDTTTAVNVTVNYTDGTTSTAYFAKRMYGANGSKEVANFVMAPKAHSSNWNEGSAEDLYANFGAADGAFNVYTYAVVPESGKTVSSITFTSSYQQTCVKVLAITTETNKTAEESAYGKIKVDSLETTTAEGITTATANLSCYALEDVDYVVVMAVYDSSDRMEKAYICEDVKGSMVYGETDEVSQVVEMSEGDYVKCFVWSDLTDELVPLSK